MAATKVHAHADCSVVVKCSMMTLCRQPASTVCSGYAFKDWYEHTVSTREYMQSKSYPCKACCSPGTEGYISLF